MLAVGLGCNDDLLVGLDGLDLVGSAGRTFRLRGGARVIGWLRRLPQDSVVRAAASQIPRACFRETFMGAFPTISVNCGPPAP